MGALVTYRLEDAVATITMDDGKVNSLSPAMLGELNLALDRAEQDRAVVVLTGRDGMFSAGFNLTVLKTGGPVAVGMLRGGFTLAQRLLAFPAPVVVACSGHAIAMGVFLVLSGDYRIGAAGAFKLTANEAAIGLTLPYSAIEICRQRLAPAHFTRVVALAEVYPPERAIEAGLLDRVAPAAELRDVAQRLAVDLTKLDRGAHLGCKLRARAQALEALAAALATDFPATA